MLLILIFYPYQKIINPGKTVVAVALLKYFDWHVVFKKDKSNKIGYENIEFEPGLIAVGPHGVVPIGPILSLY